MKHYITLFVALILLVSCNNNLTDTESPYQIPPEIEKIPIGYIYGLRAPEIKLPDVDGNNILLSELQGKLVLVDFWASWCPPCRKENPGLVKLYKKYLDTEFVNGKGFAVFSVSLDRSKEAWIKAIEDDQLSWPVQVCDMLGARTQAAINYGVQAIPSSFLLDQNGVIIGMNLRGEALEKTISELIKTK